jgi:hypothetical protein
MSSNRLWTPLRAAFVLLFLVGCHGSHVEKAEHHTHVHRPADYPTAVARLVELDGDIRAGRLSVVPHDDDHEDPAVHDQVDDEGHDRNDQDRESELRHHDDEHPDDAVSEAYDIVRWLPDIAADSDLAVEPWNRVHATANRLEVIINDAVSQNGEDRRETYLKYGAEITELQEHLLEVCQHFKSAEDSLAAGE